MQRFAFVIFFPFLFVPMKVFAITYDMVVDASSIVTAPSKPHVGQLAKVYVTVKSIGKEDVEGIVVWNDGDKLIGRKSLSLKAGGSDEDVWTTWFPTVSGTHLIRVNVVNDPGYPDASPENNFAERAIFVEGDPATSTKQQTRLATTTSTAAVSVVPSTKAQTMSYTSSTTQKNAIALTTGQQTTSAGLPMASNAHATFIGKQPPRAKSSQILPSSPKTTVTRNETGTLTIATAVTQAHGTAERMQSATSSLTPNRRDTNNEVKSQKPFNIEAALWIGAAAGALLALLFYIIARRKDKRSSD